MPVQFSFLSFLLNNGQQLVESILYFTDKEAYSFLYEMDRFQKVINATTTTSSIDLSRLNQFSDGTYQFITVPPRSIEQEYIDHVTTELAHH